MSVQTPMVGAWVVDVDGVQPFTIHGDLYFELHARRVDDVENALLALRVPEHVFAGTKPDAQQRWELTFLMGQVTGAKRVDAKPL